MDMMIETRGEIEIEKTCSGDDEEEDDGTRTIGGPGESGGGC